MSEIHEMIEIYPSLRSRENHFGLFVGVPWFDDMYNYIFYGEKKTFTPRTLEEIDKLQNDILNEFEEYEKTSASVKIDSVMDKDMENYELINTNGYCFIIMMIHILQRNKKLRKKRLVVNDLLESLNDYDFRMLQEERCIRCTTFKQFMKKYGLTVNVYQDFPETKNSSGDDNCKELAIYVGIEGCKLIFNNKHKGIDLDDDEKIHKLQIST